MSTSTESAKLSATVILAFIFIIVYGMFNHEPSKQITILIPKKQPVQLTVSLNPTYDKAEFDCLQQNIYFEAGNQSVRGKEAVALVTLARTKTKHFPSTICGVVTQAIFRNGVIVKNSCQFSWICDRKSDKPNLKNILERRQWLAAGEVAKRVITGQVVDFIGNSTHYHATYVSPYWTKSSRMKRLLVVGNHIFYRDVKLGLKA